MNRLTQDVDPVTGKTTTYTYDTRGNILTKTAAGQTVTYTYGDSTWKDLLTSYNGQTITYDTIGNPLSYRGMTFAWQQGRQLASATLANGTAITYRYNTDGIRIGKTVGNVTTEYVVDDSGTIHAMKQGEHTLIFMYDATGRREGFICYSSIYDDAAYYYLYNAQGDVIGLTDGTLNTVVQYAYDAWGNPTALTGTKASTIGTLNPFRYRGYVYDTETELYYLQSRYYDPEVGRFINEDIFVSTGQGLVGNNMFAYCGNNPVNNIDVCGMLFERSAGGGGGGGGAPAAGAILEFPGVEFTEGLPGEAIVPAIVVAIVPLFSAAAEEIDVLREEMIASRQNECVVFDAEHTKGARNSTKEKHENGKSRKNRDQGNERADVRRIRYRGYKRNDKGRGKSKAYRQKYMDSCGILIPYTNIAYQRF